jgi:hypothetical protein
MEKGGMRKTMAVCLLMLRPVVVVALVVALSSTG